MIIAKIKLEDSAGFIEACFNALKPEQEGTERVSYSLKKDKGKLIIDVKAKDMTALRAVTNTITGLLSIVDKTRSLI